MVAVELGGVSGLTLIERGFASSAHGCAVLVVHVGVLLLRLLLSLTLRLIAQWHSLRGAFLKYIGHRLALGLGDPQRILRLRANLAGHVFAAEWLVFR